MINSLKSHQMPFFDILALIAIASIGFFPALGQNRHWASREIRHAEIIREMAESGDYLVPKLLGETYYDKPPVMHAAAAVLTRIAGKPSMAVARIPSAIAGILAVLATYGIGCLLLDRRTALIGAIVLVGMPGYSYMARHARPDMILCASVLFSCLGLCIGMRERKGIPRTFWFVLAGLFAGFGTITKGPYGILVPLLFVVFTPFRRQDLKRPRVGWTSFLFGFLIAMAIWAIPAYLRDHGEYLRGVLFQPDLDVIKSKSMKSVFCYVWYGITLTLPVSLFLPLVIVDLRRRGYSAPLAIAGAIFVIISCIPKKRQHYLLPLDPFFALGVASSVVYFSATSRIVRRAAWILIPLSVMTMPLYFVAIQPFVQPYKKSEMFFANEILKIIEPNSRVYCVTGVDEVLAWVGCRYEGIQKLDRQNPSSVGQTLRNAEAGSYLVISDKDLKSLLRETGSLPMEVVYNDSGRHGKMKLFRLGGKESFPP